VGDEEFFKWIKAAARLARLRNVTLPQRRELRRLLNVIEEEIAERRAEQREREKNDPLQLAAGGRTSLVSDLP
jgi:hypothetical protein